MERRNQREVRVLAEKERDKRSLLFNVRAGIVCTFVVLGFLCIPLVSTSFADASDPVGEPAVPPDPFLPGIEDGISDIVDPGSDVPSVANGMDDLINDLDLAETVDPLPDSSGGGIADDHFIEATCNLKTLIEGSFGALLATVAGLTTIIAAAAGAFRAAWALLIVSVGAYILATLVGAFFGDLESICGGSGGSVT